MTFWITPRLGTNAEVEPYEPGVVIINVSDLIDGANNNPARIAEKLSLAKGVLHEFNHQRVIIQCHGGVSRSNTIAAGVLALWKDVDLNTALGEVSHRVPRAQYNYDLVDSVRKALEIATFNR